MGRNPKTENHTLKALSKYLEGKSHSDFAFKVKISNTHLSLCLSGKKKPSLSLCVRISQATKGKVNFKHLLPDVYREVMKHAEVEK